MVFIAVVENTPPKRKGKKDKQWSTNHCTENERLSNTNPTEHQLILTTVDAIWITCSQRFKLLLFPIFSLWAYLVIYNIRTLSVNIQFSCTSFRNRQNRELFRPVSQRVQMNCIFKDNVRILCLSCNVKNVGKLVRYKQKGQKQASFLAFHKCCQGCLLRCQRYISTIFILVCALRCT